MSNYKLENKRILRIKKKNSWIYYEERRRGEFEIYRHVEGNSRYLTIGWIWQHDVGTLEKGEMLLRSTRRLWRATINNVLNGRDKQKGKY